MTDTKFIFLDIDKKIFVNFAIDQITTGKFFIWFIDPPICLIISCEARFCVNSKCKVRSHFQRSKQKLNKVFGFKQLKFFEGMIEKLNKFLNVFW